MSQSQRRGALDRLLGSLRLVLILLVGWAVEHLQTKSAVKKVVARCALALVTVVGWMIDHLPLPPRPLVDATAPSKATWKAALASEPRESAR